MLLRSLNSSDVDTCHAALKAIKMNLILLGFNSDAMSTSFLYIITINTLLCGLAILIHYEVLIQLTKWLPRLPCQHRLRILLGLFGAVAGHIIEIWLFSFGYYFLIQSNKFGKLKGEYFNGTLLDCSYFSFTTYTSVGFGDIYPIGDIRYLTGLESLIGLVLITWTASYIYFEMQRYWIDVPIHKKIKRH